MGVSTNAPPQHAISAGTPHEYTWIYVFHSRRHMTHQLPQLSCKQSHAPTTKLAFSSRANSNHGFWQFSSQACQPVLRASASWSHLPALQRTWKDDKTHASSRKETYGLSLGFSGPVRPKLQPPRWPTGSHAVLLKADLHHSIVGILLLLYHHEQARSEIAKPTPGNCITGTEQLRGEKPALHSMQWAKWSAAHLSLPNHRLLWNSKAAKQQRWRRFCTPLKTLTFCTFLGSEIRNGAQARTHLRRAPSRGHRFRRPCAEKMHLEFSRDNFFASLRSQNTTGEQRNINLTRFTLTVRILHTLFGEMKYPNCHKNLSLKAVKKSIATQDLQKPECYANPPSLGPLVANSLITPQVQGLQLVDQRVERVLLQGLGQHLAFHTQTRQAKLQWLRIVKQFDVWSWQPVAGPQTQPANRSGHRRAACPWLSCFFSLPWPQPWLLYSQKRPCTLGWWWSGIGGSSRPQPLPGLSWMETRQAARP